MTFRTRPSTSLSSGDDNGVVRTVSPVSSGWRRRQKLHRDAGTRQLELLGMDLHRDSRARSQGNTPLSVPAEALGSFATIRHPGRSVKPMQNAIVGTWK